MEDLFLRKITIYHKNNNGYDRYVVEASFRDTIDLNTNNFQFNSKDNVTIRIFDKTFASKVDLEDIIVNKEVNDVIIEAPQTELRKKYGQNNVYKVMSKNILFFEDKVGDIEHIRLGCV